ncbi:hypothetical protein Tco_0854712 [Tanacetum coccineum]
MSSPLNMTRSSETKIFTLFANLEKQFRNKREITPISLHNIYSFYKSKSSESESEEVSKIDIETLTLEQYLSLNHNVTKGGMKRPEIGKNIKFQIKVHDLNDYQKENTFYNGLGFLTRYILYSRGLIPGLTPIKALESIQEMADHSHKWHNEEDDRRISNKIANSLSTITEKLKILNSHMIDLRENVHKIQPKSDKRFCQEEVKSIRTSETKQDNQGFTLRN